MSDRVRHDCGLPNRLICGADGNLAVNGPMGDKPSWFWFHSDKAFDKRNRTLPERGEAAITVKPQESRGGSANKSIG